MEQHLMWPDTVAIVGIAWTIVTFFYILIKK